MAMASSSSNSGNSTRVLTLRENLRGALKSWGEENVQHEIKLNYLNASFPEEGPSEEELEAIFSDKVSLTILYRFTSFTFHIVYLVSIISTGVHGGFLSPRPSKQRY